MRLLHRTLRENVPVVRDELRKAEEESQGRIGFVVRDARASAMRGSGPITFAVRSARALFGTSLVYPEFVVVNVNTPMTTGARHVDIPSFHGATREHYPLPFLKVMGRSGLFEARRVVRAGALSWFYEGTGGSYDYWPEGLCGPMLSEQPPFGNVALIADSDRMYHQIGAIGDPNAELPRMSASAYIQPDGDGNWAILDNGEVRAAYPSHAVRDVHSGPPPSECGFPHALRSIGRHRVDCSAAGDLC